MSNKLKELFEQENISNKSLIIRLRNKELQEELIKETSYLPDTVSISERAYCYKNHYTECPVCRFCGNPLRFHKMNMGYFSTCGSSGCKSKGIGEANKRHDYVKSVQKMKATYKKRTGYEHNMQNPEFVKQFFDKREKETGERYAIASERSKQARIKSFIEKYGTDNIGEILHNEKSKETIINKYGSLENFHKERTRLAGITRHNKDLQPLKNKLSEMGYTYLNSFKKSAYNECVHIKCNRCNTEFEESRYTINLKYRTHKFNFCPVCDCKENTYRSNFEQDVFDILKNEVFPKNTVFYTNKYINGVECDIVIPKYNLAIECNGLYWHSAEHKNAEFHFEKKIIVEDYGYQLFYIWEDDWYHNEDIIINKIMNICKLINYPEHELEYKHVSKQICKNFFSDFAIDDYKIGNINYGIFYNNELITAVSINKNRIYYCNTYDIVNDNILYNFIKYIKQKENISGDLIYHQDLSYVKYHNEVTYPLIWKYGDVYKNKKKEIKKITGIKPNKLIYGPGYFEIRF